MSALSIQSQNDLLQFIKDNLQSDKKLSIRGVARLCGVADKSIINGGSFNSLILAEKLEAHGFEAGSLVRDGFNATATWLTIEYFAYDSKAEAIQAKIIARTFGALGVVQTFDKLPTTKTTTSKTMKAYVTQVDLGAIEIEGLMDEQGKFYVAVPQISDTFQFPNKHASRDIKALLGEGFQFPKLSTELHPKAVNAVPLDAFDKLVVKLALKGNELAIAQLDSSNSLNSKQLFSDAFGVKFEKEERQNYLKERKAHVPAYKIYSSWGAVDGLKNGSPEYGQRCKRLKAQCSLPADVSIEDYTYEQVGALKQAEYAYDLLRKAGMSHDDAINLIR